MPFGTFSALDELAANNQTVDKIGLDRAYAALDLAIAAHNRNMMDMRTAFMSETSDAIRRSGAAATMVLQELDEWGTPDAQKLTAGANVGFPLRRFGGAIQFTRVSRYTMTGREFAAQATGMLDADITNFLTQMKQALYRATNYSFTDKFVNQVSLPVKVLQNADGFPIPPGPNGEVFNASTHTHYNGATSGGTWAAADIDSLLVANVREHFANGEVRLYIAAADAATISNTTNFPKFRALVDTRVVQANTATYINPAVAALDVMNTNNRMIGIYDGCPVWVKPWAIANYPVALAFGAGIERPLAFRYNDILPGANGLEMTFEGETHAFMGRVYEEFYGIGAWNRIAAAVLDTVHTTTYTAPL